jgi:glutaredoxin
MGSDNNSCKFCTKTEEALQQIMGWWQQLKFSAALYQKGLEKYANPKHLYKDLKNKTKLTWYQRYYIYQMPIVVSNQSSVVVMEFAFIAASQEQRNIISSAE